MLLSIVHLTGLNLKTEGYSMSDILAKEVFDIYDSRYYHILKTFYPSIGSTGLQERNLTVNFAEAYKSAFCERNVISWYELQFGDKKNNHFDCIIIDVTAKKLLIIESKRFTNTTGKSSAITNDIQRIIAFAEGGLDDRFKDFNSFSVYGVILADVWTENKKKQAVLDSFKDEEYFGDVSELAGKECIYNTIVFSKSDIDCGADYALLTFAWKIG